MKLTIKDEIRYTPEGYELRLGAPVYTRKFDGWARVSGDFIKQQYGAYSGYESRPRTLQLRHAIRAYHCTDCNSIIEKGEMHSSSPCLP